MTAIRHFKLHYHCSVQVSGLVSKLSLNALTMELTGCGGMCFQQVVEVELEQQPMWSATRRAQHSGAAHRCSSDLTNAGGGHSLSVPATAYRMRPQAGLPDARVGERHLHRAARRYRMAADARHLPALAHRPSPVRPAARRRHLEGDQPSPGRARPQAGRSGSKFNRGHDRRPERQDE